MKYVYRIVNILLAIAVYPAVLFTDFIYFGIKLDMADAAMVESITIKRIIDFFAGKDPLSFLLKDSTKPLTWPEAFQPINARLIVCAVCLGLMVLIPIFIIVWSCITGKKLPMFIAGVSGIVIDIVMIACFNSAAKEILSGNINMIKAIVGNGLLSSLFGGAFSINHLSLSGVQNALLFIYIGVAIWTAVYWLVDLGDPDAAREKQEAKEKKAAKKASKNK